MTFYLFLTACYIGTGGLFWVFEQYRIFPQYRIQPGKWPKNADYIKTLKNIFQNYILVILPMCFIAPPVLTSCGISMYGALPSVRRVIVDLIFCLLVEDFFQYLFHRALHLPGMYIISLSLSLYLSVFLFFVCVISFSRCAGIYPLIHKVHHDWTTPFALAASYAHPAEVLILGFCAFAGPLICRPHLSSFFLWIWVRQMDAVKTHSGWAWPGVDHILHGIPSYGGAVFHDYHHRSFIFNYASRFAFIDKMFGTYKVPYDPLEHTKMSKDALKELEKSK